VIPWSGEVTFNLLNIVPSSLYGAEMFNYFFTLVTVCGMIGFTVGLGLKLLRTW